MVQFEWTCMVVLCSIATVLLGAVGRNLRQLSRRPPPLRRPSPSNGARRCAIRKAPRQPPFPNPPKWARLKHRALHRLEKSSGQRQYLSKDRTIKPWDQTPGRTAVQACLGTATLSRSINSTGRMVSMGTSSPWPDRIEAMCLAATAPASNC